MLIHVGEPHNKLITVVEGTGDNLLAEDREEGYVDYLLSSIYEQDGEELNLLDSGQILSGIYFGDMSEDEYLLRVLDYWEMAGADYTILEH